MVTQAVDPLKGVERYSELMTISQVVKYFEKQGLIFSKTMIQNYVRIQLLPPPINNRFYERRHLMLLVMIDSLKTVASLEELKYLFENYYENISETYEQFLRFKNLAASDMERFSSNLQLMTMASVAKKFAQTFQ